ncbi:hypothetical protein N7540_003244 [Penicillium herquei]|nr:hypothetical protein N7540_003244 [Penicillium herquei]
MTKTESASSMEEIWKNATDEFELLTGTNLQNKLKPSFETISEMLNKREEEKTADTGRGEEPRQRKLGCGF